MSEWQPIDTAPIGVKVLVIHKQLGVFAATKERHMVESDRSFDRSFPWDAAFSDDWIRTKELTHWMPLPELPKDETA